MKITIDGTSSTQVVVEGFAYKFAVGGRLRAPTLPGPPGNGDVTNSLPRKSRKPRVERTVRPGVWQRLVDAELIVDGIMHRTLRPVIGRQSKSTKE